MNIIILTLLSLLGMLALWVLKRELTSYMRVRRYIAQGLTNTEYSFWLGRFILGFFSTKKPEPVNDTYNWQKEMMAKSDGKEPFRAFGANGKCVIHLLSHEAIAEFYKKEIGHTIKQNYFLTLKFLAFFFQNGKEVHEGRATFAKIFHYSNVMRLMPQIHLSIKNHVKALRKRVAAAKDQRLKVQLKEDFLLSLFEDLTGCILLRGADNKISATFEGMTISKVLKKMFDCFEAHPMQLISWLPFTEQLGLSKTANEFKRLQRGINKIVTEQYKNRYNSANEEDLAENSILDIMVKLNKKSERETGKPQFSLEEICDNFEAFQFAGSDTSFQVSCSLITFISLPESKEYQERLSAELKTQLAGVENLDNDKLSSLKMLDMCVRETLRMANPAAQIFPREVVKDFKLCGYQIKKGDLIRQYLVQYQPSDYKDPYKYNPDRFNEQARKKIPFTKQLGFSHGQRGCIGKYLGEMMVKLIVSELVQTFKFEVEDGYQMKLSMNPIYGVSNPDLILTLRKD